MEWPAELPPPALNTLNESPPNNDLRSNMDKGPAKVRRRTTANTRPITYSMNLTEEQVQILDDFYVEVGGFTVFTITQPRTGEVVECRMPEEPKYSEREGVLWNVSVSLEVMP